MATISRPPKIGGNTTYVAEVADDQRIIRANEVDLDFDTIYHEFNGGIDNVNIAAGADIDYAKLDLTGKITNSDIAPGAAIDRSKLQSPIIVSGPGVPGLLINSSAPIAVVTLSSLDFTGGWIILVAGLGLAYHNEYPAGGFNLNINWTWYRDTTPLGTLSQTLFHPNSPSGPLTPWNVSTALTAPPSVDTPLAGSYVYSLKVSLSGAVTNGGVTSPASNAGGAFAVVIR